MLADVTTPARQPAAGGRRLRPLGRRGLRRPTRTGLLLTLAFLVLVGGVVQGFYFGQVGADERVLVASLQPGVTVEQRERVRQECGDLPGVTPVDDLGAGRTELVERFPLRFGLTGADDVQRSALEACLNRQSGVVRGTFVEGTP